jgi:hypothetical protein
VNADAQGSGRAVLDWVSPVESFWVDPYSPVGLVPDPLESLGVDVSGPVGPVPHPEIFPYCVESVVLCQAPPLE